MKYKNIKTGAVIDVTSELSGEDWRAVEPAGTPENQKVAPAQPRKRGKAND